MRNHNSFSAVRKNWKSSFFSGNFWTLILLDPLMIIICCAMEPQRAIKLKASFDTLGVWGEIMINGWRAHYGVRISFSLQFADNARWTQPRKKRELKLIAGYLASFFIQTGSLRSRPWKWEFLRVCNLKLIKTASGFFREWLRGEHWRFTCGAETIKKVTKFSLQPHLTALKWHEADTTTWTSNLFEIHFICWK